MPGPTLREALRDVPGARVVAAALDRDEELAAFSQAQESTCEDAETVDGAVFAIFEVAERSATGFTHFLDGAQKTWLAAYLGFVPVYVSHTSAGIVRRQERDVLPPDPYDGRLEAFVPKGLVGADSVAESLPVQTFEVEEQGATGLFIQDRAKKAISDRRDVREQILARDFSDGVLLVDGGIGKIVLEPGEAQPFVVGLVKSHRKQYFRSQDRVQRILGMKAGQRTSVFWRRSTRSNERDVYSFYLKLRESSDQGPLFGLARIELPARGEFLGQVDEIAAWLLHERAPLSLPDPRFDRMLYPIRLVEQHLKARQPSDAVVRAIIGI